MIILSFPQIVALSVQLSVCSAEQTGILLEKCGKSSILRYNHSSERKGFFSSALKLTGMQVFSCQFSRDCKGEKIKQKEETVEEVFRVALHISSVYFLPHLSLSFIFPISLTEI